MSVVFVVANRNQAEDARHVSRYLDRAFAFSLEDNSFKPLTVDYVYDAPHWTRVDYGVLLRSRRALRRALKSLSGPAVLVIAQDSAIMQRGMVAVARSLGVPVVVMPDGLGFRTRFTFTGKRSGIHRRIEDVLVIARILSGPAGPIGANDVGHILSWGPAWSEQWRALAPTSSIRVTGSPRADLLAAIPPPLMLGHVLICSQPSGGYPFFASQEELRSWYLWLEAVAMSAPADRLRIRLHPREKDTMGLLPLGDAARRVLSYDSVVDDLAWADLVVAPGSTLLLEAAVVGRRVAVVLMAPSHVKTVEECDFLVDPRMLSTGSDEVKTFADLQALLQRSSISQEGLGEEWLTNVGTGAAEVATALLSIVKESRGG